MTSEQVSVSHILFSREGRGEEGARKAAEEAAARLAAGADFDKLAAELSDDAQSKDKGGRLGFIGRNDYDQAFTAAAFGLAKPGDISKPVETPYGFHLIRLDERKPPRQLSLDEARPAILAAIRAKYVDDAREMRLLPLRRDPATKVDEKAIESLITHRPEVKP